MILTPAQTIVASDVHRFRVVLAGRRFGKSQLAIEEIKGMAISRPSRIAYIAPTIQQARDIAWEPLRDQLNKVALYINESRLEIKTRTLDGKGESLIVLRGWESIDTLRGQRYDFIVIDEIASMRNFWLNWQEIIRPTLTDTKGMGLFISTPKGFNHFYDLYNLEHTGLDGGPGDVDYKSFHFTSYDNPHIPVEELEKARMELTVDRFAQEYLADFRKTSGLVYKEFDRRLHLFDPLDRQVASHIEHERQSRFAGVDFGYVHPCAVITIVKDINNNYWITDELYKTGMTEVQVAEYVGQQGYSFVYPDPESPSAIQELRKAGANVREVVKNKDSIVNGINKVRELFKSGRLKVSNRCTNLIYELETYSYPDDKGDRIPSEVPYKSGDDAMDAMRYALMTHDLVAASTRATTSYPSVHRFGIPNPRGMGGGNSDDAVIVYPKRR